MPGTKLGGQRAAATNKAKYGDNFYANIGAKGGAKGHTGGFYANRELARTAGAKGGTISRRGPWTEEQKAEARRKRAEAKVIAKPVEPTRKQYHKGLMAGIFGRR